MKAEELTALDYIFDVYSTNENDPQNSFKKDINIEYSTYHRLTAIADDLHVSIQDLLTYIYILYVNEYKLNN